MISVLVVFFLRPRIEEPEEVAEVPLGVAPVKQYVDSCIAETVEKGLLFNSLQGGYYTASNPVQGPRATDQ